MFKATFTHEEFMTLMNYERKTSATLDTVEPVLVTDINGRHYIIGHDTDMVEFFVRGITTQAKQLIDEGYITIVCCHGCDLPKWVRKHHFAHGNSRGFRIGYERQGKHWVLSLRSYPTMDARKLYA